MPLPEVYTTAQVADHYGISERYVKRICREHNIGKVVARKRLLTPSDVQKFWQQHEEQATRTGRSRTPRTVTKATQPRASRPKPAPAPVDGVRVLTARPERARAFRRSG